MSSGELDRLSDQATGGPWSSTGNGIHHSGGQCGGGQCVALTHNGDKVQRHADAEYIVALVNAHREGQVEQVRAEQEELS